MPDYDENELKRRLADFSTDSPYELGLVSAALARIERLEEELSEAHMTAHWAANSEG